MSIEDKIERNIKLAPFTTFKIGGPADFFVNAYTPEELVESIVWAKNNSKDFFILGGGSNILINDLGFKGLVIKNASRDIKMDDLMVFCDSGAPLSRIVQLARNHELSGMEWAAGLPGSLGGAVCGNAGAFGASMADLVTEVRVYDMQKQEEVVYKNSDCLFYYRHSIFKENANLVVLSATLKLKKGKGAAIEQKMTEHVTYRINNQPRYPSAGSVFKNLTYKDVVEASPELAKAAKEDGVVANDRVPAGWLVDRMHIKGKIVGGAMASVSHGNFIINKTFNATAEDVIMLISFIKQQARMNYNIMLKEEIRYVGF